jgi:hypothetical protein
MNRIEAVNLMKELSVAWSDRLTIHGFSINGSANNAKLKIILQAELFQSCLSMIQPILDKHNLAFRESDGCLVVYDSAKPDITQRRQHERVSESESSKFYRRRGEDGSAGRF